jgi:hypothetical protein
MIPNYTQQASTVRGLASGAVRASNVSSKQLSSLYKYSETTVSKRQKRIASLVAIRKMSIAQRNQNALLHSVSARLLASLKAHFHTAKREGRRQHTIAFENVWDIAQRLRDPQPLIRARGIPKPKNSGGQRQVYEFDVFGVAAQKLAVMAIQPFVRLHPQQYALYGGRSVACEELLKALNESPKEMKFIHIDIGNFYDSVSQQWIQENLPLPPRIIQHVILLDVTRRRLGSARASDEGNVRGQRETLQRGIPQGSAASPVVAEYVTADVLSGLMYRLQGLKLFSYSDNLGILCPSHTKEAALIELLRGAFNTHPAGPFIIRTISSGLVSSPFSFLGYQWEKPANGAARAYVPDNIRFLRTCKYEAAIVKCSDDDQIRDVETRVKGYCSAFPLWAGAGGMREELLGIGAAHREFLRKIHIANTGALPVSQISRAAFSLSRDAQQADAAFEKLVDAELKHLSLIRQNSETMAAACERKNDQRRKSVISPLDLAPGKRELRQRLGSSAIRKPLG